SLPAAADDRGNDRQGAGQRERHHDVGRDAGGGAERSRQKQYDGNRCIQREMQAPKAGLVLVAELQDFGFGGAHVRLRRAKARRLVSGEHHPFRSHGRKSSAPALGKALADRSNFSSRPGAGSMRKSVRRTDGYISTTIRPRILPSTMSRAASITPEKGIIVVSAASFCWSRSVTMRR